MTKDFNKSMTILRRIHPLVEQLNIEIFRAWKDGVKLTVHVTENDKNSGEAAVTSVEAYHPDD